jgi:hypothetical protein
MNSYRARALYLLPGKNDNSPRSWSHSITLFFVPSGPLTTQPLPSAMLYIKDTPPSRRDLDGRFVAYETVDGLSHASFVLAHLRRCAYIVVPIMRRHGWKFLVLAELPMESPNLGTMTARQQRTF